MSKSLSSFGAYGIMYVVKNNRNEVVALLKKYNVDTPVNADDMQLALLVTSTLKLSKSFKNEFLKLLFDKNVVKNMTLNMTGVYANADGDYCSNSQNKIDSPTSFKLLCGDSTTAKTESTTTPKTSGSLLSQGLALLQTGFNGYLQLDSNKTKRDLANASVKLTEQENQGATGAKSNGMSTGATIGLTVLGLGLIGTVIYLVVKKLKSKA